MSKRNTLIHKLTLYITELQSARCLLLDGKDRDYILKVTNINIDILEKQLETF